MAELITVDPTAHPAASVFPMLPEDELKVLAADIKQNGLQSKVKLWSSNGNRYIIDGRNRLAAIALLGRKPFASELEEIELAESAVADYVISANINRRHLAAADRARLVIEAREAEKKFLADYRKTFNDGHHVAGVSGSVKGEAAKVAKLAGTSKPVVLEQIKVKADPKLDAEVKAGKKTPAQAGREIRKRAKVKKELPSVGAIIEQQVAYIRVVTRTMTDLLPHKEAVSRNTSFSHFVKKVTELQALLAQFERPKPPTEPMRTAEVLAVDGKPAAKKQLAEGKTPAKSLERPTTKGEVESEFHVGELVSFTHPKTGGKCHGTIRKLDGGSGEVEISRQGPGRPITVAVNVVHRATKQ